MLKSKVRFGVTISGRLDKCVDQLIDLQPGVVQIPLHIRKPSVSACKSLQERGIKVIGKIIPPKVGCLSLEYLRDTFKQFSGVISTWDFGGEPETKVHQSGCRYAGKPQDFVEETRLFYTVGKEVNRSNIIGGCGWITPTFNGYLGNEDRSDFFEECCSLGIARFLDFISLNIYLYGYGGIDNIMAGTGKVKEILAKYGINKKLVVSEYGVPCAGDPTFLHIIQTPEEQAASLVKQAVLFCSVGIQDSVWFTLQWKGWGLLDEKGIVRPAYKSLKTLLKLLIGGQFKGIQKVLPKSIEERSITDKIIWCVFEKEEKDIHVIWSKEEIILNRKMVHKSVSLYDIIGNRIKLDNVKISSVPVYVVSKRDQLNQYNFLNE